MVYQLLMSGGMGCYLFQVKQKIFIYFMIQILFIVFNCLHYDMLFLKN